MPEEKVKDLLVDEYPGLASPIPKLRAQAFAELVKVTTRRQMRVVGNLQRKLPDHLLEEIVGDTYRMLWKELDSGAAGWAEKWTWGYVYLIFKNKGMRAYAKFERAKKRFGEHQHKVVTTNDDLEVYGATGPKFTEREFQTKALAVVDAVIATLPVQQRRVAEILRDNRDAKVGPKEVIELYRDAHGVALTPAAAKSSMAAVRTKLRAALKQASTD
jgi:hypothetical protein